MWQKWAGIFYDYDCMIYCLSIPVNSTKQEKNNINIKYCLTCAPETKIWSFVDICKYCKKCPKGILSSTTKKNMSKLYKKKETMQQITVTLKQSQIMWVVCMNRPVYKHTT